MAMISFGYGSISPVSSSSPMCKIPVRMPATNAFCGIKFGVAARE